MSTSGTFGWIVTWAAGWFTLTVMPSAIWICLVANQRATSGSGWGVGVGVGLGVGDGGTGVGVGVGAGVGGGVGVGLGVGVGVGVGVGNGLGGRVLPPMLTHSAALLA